RIFFETYSKWPYRLIVLIFFRCWNHTIIPCLFVRMPKLLLFSYLYYDARQPQLPPLPHPPDEQPLSVSAAPSLGTIMCSLALPAIHSLISSKNRCKFLS